MGERVIEFLTWLALPVLVVHIALDVLDWHRHGQRFHDWLGATASIVLLVHFGLDIMEVMR